MIGSSSVDDLLRAIRALPVDPDPVDRMIAHVRVFRVAGGYDHADSSTWRHEEENGYVLDWQARRNRLLDLRGGW